MKVLGLPVGVDNTDRVEQITVEDDDQYGNRDLHRTKDSIEAGVGTNWRGILSPRAIQWIEREFPDLIELAAGSHMPSERDAALRPGIDP